MEDIPAPPMGSGFQNALFWSKKNLPFQKMNNRTQKNLTNLIRSIFFGASKKIPNFLGPKKVTDFPEITKDFVNTECGSQKIPRRNLRNTVQGKLVYAGVRHYSRTAFPAFPPHCYTSKH